MNRTQLLIEFLLFSSLIVLISAQPNPFLYGRTCDGSTGLNRPLPTCADFPCDNNVATTTPHLDKEMNTAVCSSFSNRGFNSRNDGAPKTYTYPGLSTRYVCEFIPPGTGPNNRRPLVIFLHGAGGNTMGIYDYTNMRVRAETFVLSTNSETPGFIFLQPQGRNLHWPTEVSRSGANWDYYFRDSSSPSSNPDVNFIDSLIDDYVARGLADPQQIYIIGWSAGAEFTIFYATIRHETATPGGNRLASAVSFSGADPFENPIANLHPSCKANPYPRSSVPLLYISSDCDIVACNEQQRQQISSTGKETTYPAYPFGDSLGVYVGPGGVATQTVQNLQQLSENQNVRWLILNPEGQPAHGCAWSCQANYAVVAHAAWPNGENIGRADQEPTMLQFLKDHPLNSRVARNQTGRS
jgi:predicted esterase